MSSSSKHTVFDTTSIYIQQHDPTTDEQCPFERVFVEFV